MGRSFFALSDTLKETVSRDNSTKCALCVRRTSCCCASHNSPLFREEALPAQGLEQSGRHGFVVGASVADVGEYLREGFFVVYLHKFLVFGQRLFGGVVAVDVLRRIVVVSLAMHDGRHRQAVALRGCFVGVADGERGHGEGELGKFQQVDDFAGLIDGGAEKADTDAFGLAED